MVKTISCECEGTGIINGWVAPDGDYDFERCDCNVCYFGLLLNEKSYPTNPSTLCETHYKEWAEEKTYND